VNSTEPTVLKILKIVHKYNSNSMKQVIQDAVVMERLSSSPRIMDMFSLCGTSLVVKSMPFSIDKSVVPPGDWEPNNEPRNALQPSTKLEMALGMAESLADLHGFEGGVIVHGDVQLGQWLRDSQNSTLVLGDFNLARILSWDESKQRYCKYENGRGHGNVSVTCCFLLLVGLFVVLQDVAALTHCNQYRAPEEVMSKKLDEKIDVFSLGNNIYALLTGRRVFFEGDDRKKQVSS